MTKYWHLIYYFQKLEKKLRKIKKHKKIISKKNINDLEKNVNFKLTNDQKNALNEINYDLSSNSKMFRLLQGDVGTGKTIVALASALNVIDSGFQVAMMAPTEIFARQHYNLAKKIFPDKVKIDL